MVGAVAIFIGAEILGCPCFQIDHRILRSEGSEVIVECGGGIGFGFGFGFLAHGVWFGCCWLLVVLSAIADSGLGL